LKNPTVVWENQFSSEFKDHDIIINNKLAQNYSHQLDYLFILGDAPLRTSGLTKMHKCKIKITRIIGYISLGITT
jgi:hypothetical protein